MRVGMPRLTELNGPEYAKHHLGADHHRQERCDIQLHLTGADLAPVQLAFLEEEKTES